MTDHETDVAEQELQEWLVSALNSGRGGAPLEIYGFPTDALRDAYLLTVGERHENEVLKLLRRMLPRSGEIGIDQVRRDSFQYLAKHEPDMARRQLELNPEHYCRLLGGHPYGEPPWQGLSWILDLLPKWPNQAIEVAESYFLAHMMVMPDGRMHGIADVQAIIRAKWIGNPQDISGKKTLLVKLGSRRFEHLIDELYASMGYETRLTAPTRDGGRDVIASMSSPAQAVRILVECKLTTRPVGIQVLRQVLGAVAHEIANKGAIVTNAKFTTPSSKLADSDPRLELVDGDRLIPLLNQYLGANWPSHVDVHIARSLSRYSAAK